MPGESRSLAPARAAPAARRRADALAPLTKPLRVHPSALLPARARRPSRIPASALDASRAAATPDAPFAGSYALLAAHKNRGPPDARTVFSAVHLSARAASRRSAATPWPAELLHVLLRLPMDRGTLLDLVKPVAGSMAALPTVRAVELLAALTRRAAQLNAQALLGTFVDMFFDRVGRDDGLGSAELLYLYNKMASAFEGFCSPCTPFTSSATTDSTRLPRLPSAALAQVGRLTAHLMDRLDRLPSTSHLDRQITLAFRPKLLRLLFRPHMLSADNMDRLLAYLDEKGIELKREYLISCVGLAVREGDPRAAELLERFARLPSEDKADEQTTTPIHMATTPTPRGGNIDDQAVQPPPPSTDQVDLLRGRLHGNVSDAARLLEPHLRAESPLAWHVLAHRSARERAVPVAALLDIANAVPDPCVSAATMTPLMHGLVQRGATAQALVLWRGLVARSRNVGADADHDAGSDVERDADHDAVPDAGYDAAPDVERVAVSNAERGRLLDAAALSVAAEAMFQQHGLDDAVRFVDRYAARPPHATRRTPLHSVALDGAALVALLGMCNRAARPSVAFRLWDAARLRWGVEPDGAALAALVDCARFAGAGGADPEADSVRARLRALADQIRSGGGHHRGPGESAAAAEVRAAREAALATGGPAVLLDPPRFSWRLEYGRGQPWERVRDLFRAVVFGNWPALEAVRSPLDRPGFAVRSLAQLFVADPDADAGADLDDDAGAARDTLHGLPARLPENAWHAGVVPTAAAFQAYVSLLAHGGLEDEIPAALAWARRLGVRPTAKCQTTALLAVDRAEGPRARLAADGARVVLLRDEQVLRRWLEGWLGADAVPTEDDVAALSRAIMARRADADAARRARQQRLGRA